MKNEYRRIEDEIKFIKEQCDYMSLEDKESLIKCLEAQKQRLALVEDGDLSDVASCF